MTRFEPRTSGVSSDSSTNWNSTTAHMSKCFIILIQPKRNFVRGSKKFLMHPYANANEEKTILRLGCRHSSVNSSTPSILPPWVQIPSTLTMLLSNNIWIVTCRNDENKQTEAGIGALKNNFEATNALSTKLVFSFFFSSRTAVISKCCHIISSYVLLRKVLKLVKTSHVTINILSKCLISAKYCYAMLQFVCDIRYWIFSMETSAATCDRQSSLRKNVKNFPTYCVTLQICSDQWRVWMGLYLLLKWRWTNQLFFRFQAKFNNNGWRTSSCVERRRWRGSPSHRPWRTSRSVPTYITSIETENTHHRGKDHLMADWHGLDHCMPGLV